MAWRWPNGVLQWAEGSIVTLPGEKGKVKGKGKGKGKGTEEDIVTIESSSSSSSSSSSDSEPPPKRVVVPCVHDRHPMICTICRPR